MATCPGSCPAQLRARTAGARERATFVLCLVLLSVGSAAWAGDTPVVRASEYARLHVPRLDRGPKFEDFTGMRPSPYFAEKMLKVEGFKQRGPVDGAPISQRTEVYLGFTDQNLYVVCLCFDAQPAKMRTHMVRRELIDDDDQFGFMVDPFLDRKHAVFFYQNAYGIQQDGIWNDQQPDYSYDMLWRSDAKQNGEGYVAWFEIPFRSLRFPARDLQTWGIFFERDVRRNNEYAFYPHISTNVQGFMSQETEMDGLTQISPGRNMQFIPYLSMRSFRALDDRDPNQAFFTGKHVEPRAGVDAKIVLKDSLVLDATVNPDFAQVESDEPQVTLNQRFEVFFPEKRPFFLENSGYFETPINLVFTRRIADPEYGLRLTGKLGPWALGAFFADDKSAGHSVPAHDPIAGNKAYFSVLRLSHDLGKESSVGFIYTDREQRTAPGSLCDTTDTCGVGFNRIGGFDTKIKFNSQWSFNAQALASSTKFNDGTRGAGPSYHLGLLHQSRHVTYDAKYDDTAPGFQTETGFFRRPDIRQLRQFVLYHFRPEGKHLLVHGPELTVLNSWDHSGTRLEWFSQLAYALSFRGQTYLQPYADLGHERLRPIDGFSGLNINRDYAHRHVGVFFGSALFKQLNLRGEARWGTDTNFDPANGPPVLADSSFVSLTATVRPLDRLTIDNTYLLTRLRTQGAGANVFNDHIVRSKWNYQFTRALSLRVIAQYSAVLVNADLPAAQQLTSLQNVKNFNADVLLTYLIHPGTAVYVGYNSNLQNLDPSLGFDPNGNLLRTRNQFINDGRQFFVKVSYLFRF
jgi:hypothetical protein